MFSNLVESGSHLAEVRRRSKYFVGTLAFYGLLLVATGVGSIYAYDARLRDRSDYELVALMKFSNEQPVRAAEPERGGPPRSASSAQRPSVATVRELSVDSPYLRDRPLASTDTPVLSRRMAVRLGAVNNLEDASASTGLHEGEGPSRRPGTGNGTGPVVLDGGTPPAIPPRLTPTPAPTPKQDRPLTLSSSVISGKALEKPAPPYPPTAKQLGAQGLVPVLIVVDEQGRVVSAKASGGHPLLQQAAVQAAYRARFEPTRLSGQPVKVSGVITYNFVLQP